MHEIAKLYRQKHLLLTGYLEMAQTQAAMLQAGEWEKVAAVLAAKDKRIGEINQIDTRLKGCIVNLTKGADLNTPDKMPDVDLCGAGAAAEARKAVMARLEEIRAAETANAAAVQRQMEDVAREIGDMRERKAAATSYGRPVSGGGAFFDKKK